MVVGFNHNFRYKEEVFHVQTEDGGLKSPNIITLLYRGGTILASKKTSYADITKANNLDQVVEELMKEQHKEMLRRLKDGEFDEVIEGRRPVTRAATKPISETPPVAQPAPADAPEPQPAAPVAAAPIVPPPPVAPVATHEELPIVDEESATEPAVLGLDDIILSYLVGDD